MMTTIARRSGGFSLIELMIALALGLLITAGATSVFLSSRQNYSSNQITARLQENGRVGLYILANDLRHANFWGPLLNVSSLTWPSGYSLTGACSSWASTITNRFIGTTTPEKDTLFTTDCIDATSIKSSTSAVALKRLSQGPVDDFNTDLQSRELFLRTNSMFGTFLVQGTGDGNIAPTEGLSDWKYEPKVYFVRSYSESKSDGIPTLCVVQRSAADPTQMETQCLVDGIEDVYIEYGIDSSRDGTPNSYKDSPTATEMVDVVVIKIHLLVRDLSADPSYKNTNSYQLGNKAPVTFNDNFHRAVFSTTVVSQNQRFLAIR